jgi:hypothetical protein
MFVLPAMRDRAKRSMRRRGGGEHPRRGWVFAQSRPVSSLHDVFRAAHPFATRKEGTVHLFTGRTGGRRIDWILASAHFQTIASEIDRTRGPSGFPLGLLPRDCDAPNCRRHGTATARGAARIAQLYCCRNCVGG